ncbi:ABC transporter permease [Spirochaeta africana]|uniref:Transport permease protein n=1 Tax=Spirochaeta africana (strain ATCC 700263 / DSM 8902 / Z-7692) TaxID=889378 RepID=H9UIJ1_SPIAZ|nr:ABC transporter permease [Spirochaeta africana]AFG37334.1 ABC-type multidrug transport system, permease component [Spirochaeta africana DSM 8902]
MSTPVVLLSARAIRGLYRRPGGFLGGLAMSLFFLVVYHAGIGGVAALADFGPGGYLGFIFPMSIVSLAMGSAAGAGQSLHRDMQSGYFRRLVLSPSPLWAVGIAAVAADAAAAVLGAAILTSAAVIAGMPLAFGWLSLLGILGISLLWGIFLSALSAGVMLRTGSADGARLVTTAVFPLLFLSTTFMPLEMITSSWLRTVARGNPVTYLMEALRYMINGGPDRHPLQNGIILLAILAAGALLFAARSARQQIE